LGEKDAFAQLVRRHGPALYRFVFRLLGDPSDAQDCTQEALFAAWKGVASFRGGSSFRTWLLVLGRNEARKSQQRNRPPFPQSGSRASLDFDEVTAQLRDLHVGPEGDTLETGLLVALDAALLQLPERQRAVWILREIEDLSHAEIGSVLGASPTVVRGLLQRARAAIAATMEEWR
jgi:RNA polymerase sigma-70 factor (ECF subfamily)